MHGPEPGKRRAGAAPGPKPNPLCYIQDRMQVESALFFETSREIYARVFRELRPRPAAPEIEIQFRRFANLNSSIRMVNGRIVVRMSDLLEGAPAPVLESLAYILVSKMLRLAVPAAHIRRYRLFVGRREVRRSVHLVRQQRGRKFLSGPAGRCYHLEEIFEEMNRRFFNGLMARPQLGWSRRESRTVLGHFDPSHNAIILSRLLDRGAVPRLVLEYVMYHEMLHLKFPVELRSGRRVIHGAEFRAAEKTFPGFGEAKAMLRRLG